MTNNKYRLFKIIMPVVLFAVLSSAGISQKDEKIPPRMRKVFSEKNPGEELIAWIYFRDKGPGRLHKLEEVKMTLTTRSLKRRLRQGFDALADEFDIPVYQPYVDSLRPFVSRVRHTSRWLNAASVEATSQSLEQISTFRFVKRVDEVLVYTYRDPERGPKTGIETTPASFPRGPLVFDYGMSLSQVEQLKIPALHNLGYSGEGVLVCMLDDGFNNLNHRALDHLDILATWDFVNDDPDVSDEVGQAGNGDHGTRTLGTIAGYEPGELIGPAFGASFLLGKTENSDWERHVEEDHWIAGAEWADTLGADIISSSLGYRDQFTNGEEDYSWQNMDGNTTVVAKGANIAASRGILIVNSAGNEGFSRSGQNTLVSPADCEQVVAAGAVNSQGKRVSFSSVGPTADGRIKPDVMAMGESVYSAAPGGINAYEFVDGTSFSCPLVAGVAALVLEINPSWTNQDIMTAIKSTAGQSDFPDNGNGWGIVDAQKAAFFPLKRLYAPQHFAVSRLENNYGFFIQYVDQLTWEPNPRNANKVSFYRIYAKQLEIQDQPFELIAELDGQTFGFMMRGLLEDETFLYKITAVSASGKESGPNYARR
jgi:serine protease AprX